VFHVIQRDALHPTGISDLMLSPLTEMRPNQVTLQIHRPKSAISPTPGFLVWKRQGESREKGDFNGVLVFKNMEVTHIKSRQK